MLVHISFSNSNISNLAREKVSASKLIGLNSSRMNLRKVDETVAVAGLADWSKRFYF